MRQVGPARCVPAERGCRAHGHRACLSPSRVRPRLDGLCASPSSPGWRRLGCCPSCCPSVPMPARTPHSQGSRPGPPRRQRLCVLWHTSRPSDAPSAEGSGPTSGTRRPPCPAARGNRDSVCALPVSIVLVAGQFYGFFFHAFNAHSPVYQKGGGSFSKVAAIF